MEWSDAVKQYFQARTNEGRASGADGELAALLAAGQADAASYDRIVSYHGLRRELWFRKNCVDLLLGFVTSVLELGPLDNERQHDVARLKDLLDIREGEFVALRPAQVAALLQGQFEVILQDGEIDEAEDLYRVALQRAFDLGYDQYLALTRKVVERAWLELTTGLGSPAPEGPKSDALRNRRLLLLEPLYRLATTAPRSPL